VVCGAGDLSGHALTGVVCIGEGPESLSDLRSVAGRPREPVETHGRACTQVLFLRNVELGFFYFLEIVTGWLVPSAGQKIPVQHGWYLPPQKIPLAENRFRQGGKGGENTKEKSRQCFTYLCVTRFWSVRVMVTYEPTKGFSVSNSKDSFSNPSPQS
jgi:hypothetical protein